MTYYPDLSTECFFEEGPEVRAIGWLSADYAFSQGAVSPEFFARLEEHNHGLGAGCIYGHARLRILQSAHGPWLEILEVRSPCMWERLDSDTQRGVRGTGHDPPLHRRAWLRAAGGVYHSGTGLPTARVPRVPQASARPSNLVEPHAGVQER
jgi:hypothetical protein